MNNIEQRILDELQRANTLLNDMRSIIKGEEELEVFLKEPTLESDSESDCACKKDKSND